MGWRTLYTRTDKYIKGYISKNDCDSVVTLNLSVVPHCSTERTDERTICSGSTYDFYGTLLDRFGTYTHLVENADCDTLVTLNLTVAEHTDSIENVVICEGESHWWHGREYNKTTVENEILRNAAGCDSMCTLNLTVNPRLYGDTIVTLCDETSFTWHGERFTTSGDYPHTYYSHVTGCDSIVTMHLSLLQSTDSIENAVICEGETHWWHGREYRQTTVENEILRNAAGCDSVCTLNLTVNPKLYGDTTVTLCDETSFTWHGERFTTSGDYPHTYYSHVTGCDSIVTMHLSLLNSTDSIENAVICEGETHCWHGREYRQTTVENETLRNAAGCDSICTLNLTVNPRLYGDTIVTLCDETSFTWHGERFTTSGDYPHTYYSHVTGCDSIVTMHLSLLHSTDSIENVVICEGESHWWHGREYRQTTVENEILRNAVGCDSICTLNLTVNPRLYGDTTVTLCDAPSFTWHGERFSTSGDYPYRYSSRVSGCDSIVTLHLSLLQSTDSVETAVICAGETYRWHGMDYTQSTTVSETLVNSAGCDSVCTLNLTVNPILYGDTSVVLCDTPSFTWHGERFSTSGDYPYRYSSRVSGCDSIVTLHLSLLQSTDSVETAVLCAGETYRWHGRDYTQSTTVSETLVNSAGCDSVCTLNLTVNPTYNIEFSETINEGEVYRWEGYKIVGSCANAAEGNCVYDKTKSYRTITGCDSILTLHLSVIPKIEIFGIAIDEQCGGPGVLEIVIQNNGQPAKVQLTFSQNALSNGFQNGEYDLVGDRITIPYNARAGHYSVEVMVMQGDMVRYRKTHKFTLLYPSTVLEQGWLDAVLVLTHDYNGGYDFTAFQWYKNGQKLVGETGPYIYQPLTIGAAYQALLTDTEGLTLMTCPLIAVPFVDITMYPTEVQRNNIIRCHVSQPADIMLYSAVGQLIKTYTVPEGDSDITAPETSGLFMAKIVTINGDKKIIKIIVK